MAPQPIQHINKDLATKIKLESSKSFVTVKVQGGEDHDVYYRVKRDFPLHHLKLHYCNRLGLDYGVVRFVYGEKELPGDKTPDNLLMNDGCIVDAFLDKLGG